TASGDSIAARSGHSAVLTQDGLILIYGGQTGNGSTYIQAQPDVAVLDVSVMPYTWKAITDKAPQSLMDHSATICGIYMIIAFGAVVPSQPQPVSSPLTLNNNLYIFNTQNYTWVNTFDASNMYVSNSTQLKDSVPLDVKLGVGITVLVITVSIVIVAGFLIYKKIRARNPKATFERI
ncbi:40777_t:CDS:2, partial [Gigaspora margarita]